MNITATADPEVLLHVGPFRFRLDKSDELETMVSATQSPHNHDSYTYTEDGSHTYIEDNFCSSVEQFSTVALGKLLTRPPLSEVPVTELM